MPTEGWLLVLALVGTAVGGTWLIWWARRGVPAERQHARMSLSEAENLFRTSLLERVGALETKVSNLEQQNLEYRQHILDWRETYLILRGMYLALVERLGPGADPPPPPPPPPPEGSGGGLLTSGPSPRPRTMPSLVRAELLDLLDGTTLAAGAESRDNLLADMPPGMRARVKRSSAARADLSAMITAALDFGGDPPCLSLWLDAVEDALGQGTEAQRAVAVWRAGKRW